MHSHILGVWKAYGVRRLTRLTTAVRNSRALERSSPSRSSSSPASGSFYISARAQPSQTRAGYAPLALGCWLAPASGSVANLALARWHCGVRVKAPALL